jgi:hypothetical protein
LQRIATIHWEGVPLRDAIGRLTNLFQEPLFVDRRLDPALRVSLNVQEAPLDEVLTALGATAPLGVSRLDRLRYLGPPAAAAQLRTVAAVRSEELAQLPASQRAAFQKKGSLRWPRLTEPRGLVSALIQKQGWRVGRAERIPHDLWPEGSLPAISLSDQLTMLLVGFDLTFKANPAERTLEIVPLTPLTISRRYRVPAGHPDVAALLQQLPRASATVQGQEFSVEARIEDHERLSELLRRQPAQRAASPLRRPAKQVYTLRVEEQPVGAVLEELAARLQWPIEIDSEAITSAGLSLDARVSFSIENSDQDELLEAVLRPAGLDYRRDEHRLRIVPREPRR